MLCSIVVFYPKNNATDEKVVSETKTGWGEPVSKRLNVKTENGKLAQASENQVYLSFYNERSQGSTACVRLKVKSIYGTLCSHKMMQYAAYNKGQTHRSAPTKRE